MGEEDGGSCVCERGNLMAECNKKYPGTMLAVLRADQEMLEALCEEYKVYPVNYNCPGQVSVAGKVERIEQFKERLTAEKIRFIPLSVSGSFHTPHMKHVSIGLLKYFEEISIQSPRIPMYANTTSKPYLEEKALINHLISRQVSHSVQWEKILRRMHANGCDIFIECGPGQTLSGFVKKTLKDVDIYNVNDMESLERTCESLAVYA